MYKDNQYVYSVRSHFGSSGVMYHSGTIRADSMDEAHSGVLKRHKIDIVVDRFDADSILAGEVHQIRYMLNKKRVEIAIQKPASIALKTRLQNND